MMTVVELLVSGPAPWLDPELRAALLGTPQPDRCDQVSSTVPSPGPPPLQEEEDDERQELDIHRPGQ